MTAASWAYFDTSVLLKGYVPEPGKQQADSLARRHAVASSAITSLELTSALTRRRLGGELTEAEFRAGLRWAREDRDHWHLVDVTAGVLARAETIVHRTALKTLDAIHVASCLLFAETIEQRVPFVTADAQQRSAAERLALPVVWVA